MATIDTPKKATQIAMENQLPLSSTYKKIKKLQSIGVMSIEKIDIDGDGKKVLYYRSEIKSLEFNVTRNNVLLRLEKNDLTVRVQ